MREKIIAELAFYGVPSGEQGQAADAILAAMQADLAATRKQLAEAQADNANIHSAAHRLALESECFWRDCKDMPVQSKWMNPMLDAIGQVHSLRWRGDITALSAAIAEAVEPWRSLSDRMQRHMVRTKEADALTVEFAALAAKGAEHG